MPALHTEQFICPPAAAEIDVAAKGGKKAAKALAVAPFRGRAATTPVHMEHPPSSRPRAAATGTMTAKGGKAMKKLFGGMSFMAKRGNKQVLVGETSAPSVVVFGGALTSPVAGEAPFHFRDEVDAAGGFVPATPAKAASLLGGAPGDVSHQLQAVRAASHAEC